MKIPYNIEGSKYGKTYRVGYDAKGFAVRIYGESGRYCVNGKCLETLKQVSEYLSANYTRGE